ncbi:MAG: ComF family protein [Bdellovibrionales bacterium]|nr:ComF family protein [Bdellovibrionales bacterium]
MTTELSNLVSQSRAFEKALAFHGLKHCKKISSYLAFWTMKGIGLFSDPRCLICSLPEVEDPTLGLCQRCWTDILTPKKTLYSKPCFEMISCGIYEGPLRGLILTSKMRNSLPARKILWKILRHCFHRHLKQLHFDQVIPIPLHYWRTAWRGIDLPGHLSYRLYQEFDLNLQTKLLRRARKNKRQSSLDLGSRKANVKGLFESSAILKNQSILLIDDVVTSGATIKEACKILQKAGAQKVTALTLAKKRCQAPF